MSWTMWKIVIRVSVIPMLAALMDIGITAQTMPITRSTPELLNALRSGGLSAAARVVGNYVGVDDDDSESAVSSLANLASTSHAIAVVTVVHRQSAQLTSDGKSITTDFLVTVEEHVKGDLTNGSNIIIRLRGGRVAFDNGTSAELRSARNHAVVPNQKLVIFMQHDAVSGVFMPLFGSQGIFDVNGGGLLQSRGRPVDEMTRFNGTPLSEFLNDVRAVVH